MPSPKKPLRFISILRARCPHCQQERVMRTLFHLHRKCPQCEYDFYPESGFYLGAMIVSYLLTAILTIPPIVILKLLQVDMFFLIAYPFIQYLFVGTFLLLYSRVIWLHVEYRLMDRLDGKDRSRRS